MLSVLSRTLIRGRFDRTSSICAVTQRNLMQVERKESAEKNKLTLQKYLFDKCSDVIDYFEKKLETKFPKTIQVYRIFGYGMKEFMLDAKRFMFLGKKIILNGPDNLTREELQLTYVIPKDMYKIAPFFLISILPFAQYVTFPLAYKFPRQLLTSHFWTTQQKSEFALLEQKKRLKHNESLFQYLQAEVENIEDPVLKSRWKEIVERLVNGTHPSTADIIACCDLFKRPPYSLGSLKKRYVKELLAIHGISTRKVFKTSSLRERGYLILRMDRAIDREGGVEKLQIDSLRWALSFRGVNPANICVESMRNWLNDWLIVSRVVDQDSISLLLHAPILLAYNHPANRTLTCE